MVMVPLRAAPGFGLTMYSSEPLPVPATGWTSQIHESPLSAIHLHPAGAWMVRVAVPPVVGNEALVVGRSIEHVVTTAAWVTVNVCPATVTVPVRALAPLLAATVKETAVALVVVTVIQEALEVAVQAQPVEAVTSTLPLPPAAEKDSLVADSA
jgi:hypothetical protein